MSSADDDRRRKAQLSAFRAYIDLICDERGMSRSAIAKAAGMTASTLNKPYKDSDWPNFISLRTIMAVANATGVEPLPGLLSNAPATHAAEIDEPVNDPLTIMNKSLQDEDIREGENNVNTQYLTLMDEVSSLPAHLVPLTLRIIRNLKMRDAGERDRPPRAG